VFFSLPSWAVALLILAVVGAACVVGTLVGRYLRRHTDALREPIGVLQAAILGVVGLILAFGLSLAVGRYESRRAAVVEEANAIGTTYLRAQLIAEPARTESLDLLRRYTDLALEISDEVPASSEMKRTAARQSLLQRRLWGLAGEALEAQPTESGTRLYVDSLNNMIDQQTVRIAALSNRVPGAVLGLEVIAGAVAVGLLALYLAVLGRGLVAVISAAVLVTLLLLVTFDLDRPTRGLIKIPATPLESVRASMIPPPAAGGG
jgi:hypothetical protein